MTANQFGSFVSASQIFPNIESDLPTLKRLLRSLNCEQTLLWCAKLNCVISELEVEHIAKQQFGLDEFLTPEEIERVNDIARMHDGGAQEVTVFFRGQLLELIRWAILYCDEHPNDYTTFEDPEIKRSFARAALVASDIFSKRVFGNRFSLDDGIDIAGKRALGAIRKAIE
jgi:hypothetical protein